MRAGDFQLDLQQKRCGMIKDVTSRKIGARHMSKHGLEGLPEQGIDTSEIKTRANDKWVQSTTQQKKGKVGWPHRPVGRPPWSADGPVGPHLNPTTWSFLIGCRSRFREAQLQMALPLAMAPSYK